MPRPWPRSDALADPQAVEITEPRRSAAAPRERPGWGSGPSAWWTVLTPERYAPGVAEAGSDLVEEYRSYLQRFEEQLGPCDFGEYAKHKGRLIKKLRYDEFELKFKEFNELDRTYSEILERGDTINDVLVKVLRERSDELMLERKL